ncbi:MAG: hypothetical protein FWC16_10695 [Defluviitaleaceae bacterium]|nr:hypothetical protein [Defluviitaleaceae bacterium]MCL2275385.1 hypothetical protein [Defluviitaleaceae bacterium]
MKIKALNMTDISKWIVLSKEYDVYVREVISDLSEWYGGNGTTSESFDKYMKRKINNGEAFMAVDDYGNCCGIIAISRNNNNITFFGISHESDVVVAGDVLLNYALSKLDSSISVKLNELKSNAGQIQKIYALLDKSGFVFQSEVLENGVPVNQMVKKLDSNK